MPSDSRREVVLDALSRLFGPLAASPRSFAAYDWTSDPRTRGGEIAYPAPTALVQAGDLPRAPHGRVHWAGTESAHGWHGFMEGALRSGRRAATAILTRAPDR
jgi:monoamine oxidase